MHLSLVSSLFIDDYSQFAFSWDFNYYPVCVFAYRLLEEIFTYPLFYVSLLNPSLYNRSNLLSSARWKRQQLNYMKSFIELCRFATLEASFFEAIPNHIASDIDLWSMSDIFNARSKYLHKTLDALIVRCESHISNCVVNILDYFTYNDSYKVLFSPVIILLSYVKPEVFSVNYATMMVSSIHG